ncbi:hypothetical protein DRQ07_11700 [candidate division KSB1 bacterium]|nr:MAG: hypothetical protein DRQ07_11700 [candidate division KSB1 bacterium]
MITAVNVERVTLDTSSNRFVVILKDQVNSRWLPIVVGPAEAHAIALQLENVSLPRPMTHDLLKNILDSIKASLVKIVVNDLKDNTYYAVLELSLNGERVTIDSRPSDAIALALRTKSPIFVEEEVMKKASINDMTEEEDMANMETEIEELRILRTKLQEAVKEERYEDAARYRDAINELMEKLGKTDNEQNTDSNE